MDKLLYLMIRMTILWMSLLPLCVGQFLGRLLGRAVAMVPMSRTEVALENIRQSMDALRNSEDPKRLIRKVFEHFGQMLFEVPHILKMNPRNLRRYVAIENREVLINAVKKGKGVFVLTGHFGNWELMAAAVSLLLRNTAVVVRPIDFRPLDSAINEMRSRFGTEIITKQRAMRRLIASIKQKKIIGILLDQNVDWYEGVFVRFMGKWACTNKGLALMALRTGAPVIPAFPVRQADGRYRIVFGNEINLIKTGDKTRDVEENTALFTGIIEMYIRAFPDHWFWFHRRWKTRPYCPLPGAGEKAGP